MRVQDSKAFEASPYAKKALGENPLAIEIDGKFYKDFIWYSGWRSTEPWLRVLKTRLVLNERWQIPRDVPPIGGPPRGGTPLHLEPGKHTLRVLFIGLGQKPIPASESFEIEILPAENKLAPWQHPWGDAVEGVRVGVYPTKRTWPQGSEPALLVRVRNLGDREWMLHNRPPSFALEIDGQPYRNQYSYPS